MKKHMLAFTWVYLTLFLCFLNTTAADAQTGVPPSSNPAGRAIFPAQGQN